MVCLSLMYVESVSRSTIEWEICELFRRLESVIGIQKGMGISVQPFMRGDRFIPV